MKTLAALFVCFSVGSLLPLVGPEKTSGKLDPKKLIGQWDYVSGIKDGVKVDPGNLKKGQVRIEKEKLTLTGDDTFVMKYTLDTSKQPAGISLEILESPFGGGAKAVGIIEVNGDNLRICYTPMGETAPKTFEAKEGSKTHLFVLKRSK